VSGSWIVGEESWWPDWAGEMKVRGAYGRSGRAPGAFDAVRTWNPVGWGSEPAFTPRNVGNKDLGPEVTGELEAGFDASWLDDRIQPTFSYYRQVTRGALMNVPQVPSSGFSANQRQNVGKIRSSGLELGVMTSPVRLRDWGWDVGANISLNESEILDLGRVPSTATLQVGRPLRSIVTFRVTNPDEIAEPQFEANYFFGPNTPTEVLGASTTLRVPAGVTLSARGEYRGGFYMNEGVFSVDRSVRSPLCLPYYAQATGIALQPGIPALWRARCTPQWNRGYVWKGDYFKLRSVSASTPLDVLFPERIQSATLTMVLENAFLWMREMPFMDPEMGVNTGANSQVMDFNERIPAPISLRVALRVTF
jgi:hypothetical protein